MSLARRLQRRNRNPRTSEAFAGIDRMVAAGAVTGAQGAELRRHVERGCSLLGALELLAGSLGSLEELGDPERFERAMGAQPADVRRDVDELARAIVTAE